MSFLLEQFGLVVGYGKAEISRLYNIFQIGGPILCPKDTW